MTNKKIVLIIAILFLLTLCFICSLSGIGFYIISREARVHSVSNFGECEAFGYPVAESYPRQCRTPDGRVFYEEYSSDPGDPLVSPQPSSEKIILYTPGEEDTITSPLVIKGEALGSWFWEGTFRIELQNRVGTVLASTFASAEEPWMQDDYVSFSAKLDFDPTLGTSGFLVFIKENPSGLPENDDSYSIPISISAGVGTGCFITGCSNHICSDQEESTTCEFLDHYACYGDAVCERQSDGRCGWTQTPELLSCIEENSLTAY